MARWRWLVLSLVLGAGCDACEGCADARKVIEREMKSPPPDDAARLLKEALRRAKETAAQACGLEAASGLEAEKITPKGEMFMGSGSFEVEGKPIDAKAEGGVALGKALTCVLVVYASYRIAKSDEHGNVSEWRLGSHRVDEVKTPGAEWVRPVEVDD